VKAVVSDYLAKNPSIVPNQMTQAQAMSLVRVITFDPTLINFNLKMYMRGINYGARMSLKRMRGAND
jgi:hypothetical protein